MRSERERSSIGPGSRGAAAADVVRVTVVAGLPSPAKSDLVEALAARAPHAVVVHESRAAGPEGLLARLCSDPKRPDAIAVLLPGSEPRLYAARWSEIAETRPSIRIERIVTSVEVATLRGELASSDSLASRGWATGPCDGRSVADLAVEQIEFADALLLHSGPGAAGRDRTWSEELAAALNAHAARIDASACRLDPRLLDGAPHFAFEETVRAARWFRALDNRGFGLEDARVLRFDARAPFHPGRLGALLSGRPGRFVRAKGLCWISNEPEYALGLSVAGAVSRLFRASPWWAALPAECWPANPEARARISADWDPRFGDRRQRLAFVGPDLDAAVLRRALEGCLQRAWDAPLPAGGPSSELARSPEASERARFGHSSSERLH